MLTNGECFWHRVYLHRGKVSVCKRAETFDLNKCVRRKIPSWVFNAVFLILELFNFFFTILEVILEQYDAHLKICTALMWIAKPQQKHVTDPTLVSLYLCQLCTKTRQHVACTFFDSRLGTLQPALLFKFCV
jgi:hypothetical protein